MTITVTDLGGQEFGKIDPQAQDDQNNSNHENLCSVYAHYATEVESKTGLSPSSSTMYVLLGGGRSDQPEEALDSFTLSTIGKLLPEGKQLRIMMAVDGAHTAETIWESFLLDAERKWEFYLAHWNHVKGDDFYKKPLEIEQLLNELPVDTGKIPIRYAMLMLDLQMQLVKRLGCDELDDEQAALDFHAMFNQWFSAPIRKILQYLKSNQPDNDFFVCWSRDYLSAIIDALKLRTVDHYQDYNSRFEDQDYYSLFEVLRYLAIPRTFEHNSWLLVTFYLELTRRGNINIEIFTETNSFSNWLRLMVSHVVRRVDENKDVDYLTWRVAAIWEKIAHIPENQIQDPKSKNTLIEIVNMFKSHLSEILGLKCGSIIVIKGLIEFPVEVAGDQSRPHALLYQYPFDDIPFPITEGIYEYYAGACKESAQNFAQGNEYDIPNTLTTNDLVSCIFFSRTFSRYQEFAKKMLTHIFHHLPLANKKNILEKNVQPYLRQGVDIYTCFLRSIGSELIDCLDHDKIRKSISSSFQTIVREAQFSLVAVMLKRKGYNVGEFASDMLNLILKENQIQELNEDMPSVCKLINEILQCEYISTRYILDVCKGYVNHTQRDTFFQKTKNLLHYIDVGVNNNWMERHTVVHFISSCKKVLQLEIASLETNHKLNTSASSCSIVYDRPFTLQKLKHMNQVLKAEEVLLVPQQELRQALPPTDDSLSDKLQKSNDTAKAADKSTQCNASSMFSDPCNHPDPSRDADVSEINNQPPKHELKKQRIN